MSKITLKIDSSLSYEEALEEFEKIYMQELEHNKERKKIDSFLSNLHELVNSQLNTKFGSTNSLIQALIPYSSPAFQEKISKSQSGRRKTISMNKETFLSIKKLLSKPQPNKAAIAREVGVSVVQVRKVATGGYDKKFGASIDTTSKFSTADILNKNDSPLSAKNPIKPVFGNTLNDVPTKPSRNLTRPPMKLPVQSPLDL